MPATHDGLQTVSLVAVQVLLTPPAHTVHGAHDGSNPEADQVEPAMHFAAALLVLEVQIDPGIHCASPYAHPALH